MPCDTWRARLIGWYSSLPTPQPAWFGHSPTKTSRSSEMSSIMIHGPCFYFLSNLDARLKISAIGSSRPGMWTQSAGSKYDCSNWDRLLVWIQRRDVFRWSLLQRHGVYFAVPITPSRGDFRSDGRVLPFCSSLFQLISWIRDYRTHHPEIKCILNTSFSHPGSVGTRRED